MRAPEVETAIELYYAKTEIGSQDIKRLFDVSDGKASALKKQAREAMREKGVITIFPTNVNTKAAYEAWGLDIAELERKYRKLASLGFLKEAASDG